MARKIFLQPAAINDIRNSTTYIDKSNPIAAEEFVSKVKLTTKYLSEFPEIGRKSVQTKPSYYRFLIAGYKHWLLYTYSKTQLEIIRVIHTSRDFDNLV